MKSIITLFALVTSILAPIHAAIVEHVGQRASSEFASLNRIATWATNGAGLFVGAHSEVPNGTMWLSSDFDTAGTFEIDLGAVYNVHSIRVWNYNEFVPNRPDLLDRGIALANIDLGLTPSTYTTVIADQPFAQAPGTNSDFSEVIMLAGAAARFIRLDILANHGNPQYTGLAEIQVDGTLVPGQRRLNATIAGASTTIGAPFNRLPEHVVNYNGVFGQSHSVVPDGNMWLGAEGDIAPVITFDLGAVEQLSHMLFWNYNEFLPGRDDLLTRGVAQGDILLSDDGINFSPFLNDVSFALAPGDNLTEYAERIDLTGATARYVQLAVDFNFGNPMYTGISEVRFFAIPEPTSAALLAFALVPLCGRRRGW